MQDVQPQAALAQTIARLAPGQRLSLGACGADTWALCYVLDGAGQRTIVRTRQAPGPLPPGRYRFAVRANIPEFPAVSNPIEIAVAASAPPRADDMEAPRKESVKSSPPDTTPYVRPKLPGEETMFENPLVQPAPRKPKAKKEHKPR